jgi:uncharacterized protein (TIGR03437 family)
MPDFLLPRRRFLQLFSTTGIWPGRGQAGAGSTLAWLQNVGQESASLFWLSRKSEGSATAWNEGYLHKMRVSGLEAGKEGTVEVEGRTVRVTAAPRQGSFRFLAFGDSGSREPEQIRLAEQMGRECAELVLHTGDLAYPSGTAAEISSGYLNVYGEMMARVPFFAVAGNHDYGTGEAKAFLAVHEAPDSGVKERDRGRYYSFDWGGAHFIGLDSNRPLLEAVEEDGAMLGWLEEDLRKHAGAYWKIAFFHHPPYAGGPNQEHMLTKLARSHIAPILERHGVQLVLNSHEHSYQRSHPLRGGKAVEAGSGTMYVTSGGGGAMLYPVYPMEQVAVGQPVHHYLRVTVNPWRVKIEAVDIEQQVIDTVEVAPRPEIRFGGLVSAAGDPGRMAAGSIVSLYGRNLCAAGQAGEVRVSVNGQEAKVLFGSGAQINAVLPLRLPAEAVLRVETPNGGAETGLKLSAAAPAILAIAHPDGGLVTAQRPAKAGESVVVMAAGLGVVDPDGVVRLKVEATVGGLGAEVAGARLYPAMAGVYSVAMTVPGRSGGGARAVVLLAGGVTSNAVTVMVI